MVLCINTSHKITSDGKQGLNIPEHR